ncbi:hypothetical protein C8E01_10266 [Pontibacter virosus]|uniref:Uncharacterized protein n=1 Tax=Pontibacter virosus TaxID=1765052 RepID=A0A2U1B2Q9_9BACT|nr:hypothetical protein C8E01_10266 [Pontibacter virosus]
MPVSRNRKKQNNQNNNYQPRIARPMCVHELFEMQFNNCRKCGRPRDKFEYDELPKEEQQHWDESGVQESIDFIVYCPSCEENSAILEVDH